MKSVRSPIAKTLTKAPTGAIGFDEITGGDLPRGRTTVVMGGPGSGKTILALQFLAHGARNADHVVMTPTLVKLAPSPVRRIVGTLSHSQILMHAPGLAGAAA